MPGLVDVAWFIYSNSGPALDLVFIGLVVLGYKYEIQPRLTDLEDVQDNHADELQDKALNAAERDVMLENAHERIDDHDDLHQQAEEVRASLRSRINRLERREAWRSGGGDGGGGPPPIGPDGGVSQSLSADGGRPGGVHPDRPGEPMTDGGTAATQEANGSDDDHLDLSLTIDVDGDAYVHVETAPQDADASWMQKAAGGGER